MVSMVLTMNMISAAAVGIAVGCATMAQAQQLGAIYAGTGAANEEADLLIDDAPFVVGVLFYRPGQTLVFGADIAAEGEMLDSTFGSESLRQAYSFNALIGGNLYQTDTFRSDLSVIIGARETFADCPDSFLGFQCYADAPPTTEYTANYGLMLSFAWDLALFGVRVTDQSTQAVIGLAF